MSTMDPQATQTLSQYIADSRFDDLPDDVIDKAKMCVLDSLGCALGGTTLKAGRILSNLMAEVGGNPESTLLPRGPKVPAVSAAYANSHMANLMDFDDTLKGHPGACIIPPALALAEKLGSSGRELINAVVLGYEVGMRILNAVRPSNERMQKAPQGPGTRHIFGAVTAASALLRLDADTTAMALGLAGVNAPVPSSPTARGERPVSWSKFNHGWASQGGVLAALLAQKGFLSSKTILDGDKGFWVMAGSDQCDFDAFTRGFGQEYITRNVAFKTFPCCRFLHSSIEALQKSVLEYDISPTAVKRIHVQSFGRVAQLLDYAPANEIDVQFSLPYVMVMGLLGKSPGYEWLAEANFRDHDTLALLKKVSVEVDPEAERKFRDEGKESSTVLVNAGGKEFKSFVIHPRGLITHEELQDKFRGLAVPVLGEPASEGVIEAVEHLDDLADVSTLLQPFLGASE